jgi:hypothetical protein
VDVGRRTGVLPHNLRSCTTVFVFTADVVMQQAQRREHNLAKHFEVSTLRLKVHLIRRKDPSKPDSKFTRWVGALPSRDREGAFGQGAD